MASLTINPLLAAMDPVAHVIDSQLIGWVFSNASLMLFLSAGLTAAVLIPAAKRIATGPGGSIDDLRAKGLLANFVEAICLYLRDEIFKPILKDQTDRFMPILWTFFWFILFCNLLGLVPLKDLTGGLFGWNHGHGIGGTATQSIWVTGALAVASGLIYNVRGFMDDPKAYVAHLTAGAPWPMWPLIVPLELVSNVVIKPFALAVRLFANMTGGHVLLAALFAFVGALAENMQGVGLAIGIVPLLGAVAINLLEVLVALIQAFIFTFLTGLFLASFVVHEHHGDEHHDHGHESFHDKVEEVREEMADPADRSPAAA